MNIEDYNRYQEASSRVERYLNHEIELEDIALDGVQRRINRINEQARLGGLRGLAERTDMLGEDNSQYQLPFEVENGRATD